MLHISSTHQMQPIHLNDLTLICPYVGVLGVGVRCSLSETGSEQAKKPQPVNGNGQFSKKYGSGPPPPNPYISEKPYSRPFQIYPTYPYLRDTQWTQMRQQWHRPPKTHKVGRFGTVPERYVSPPLVAMAVVGWSCSFFFLEEQLFLYTQPLHPPKKSARDLRLKRKVFATSFHVRLPPQKSARDLRKKKSPRLTLFPALDLRFLPPLPPLPPRLGPRGIACLPPTTAPPPGLCARSAAPPPRFSVGHEGVARVPAAGRPGGPGGVPGGGGGRAAGVLRRPRPPGGRRAPAGAAPGLFGQRGRPGVGVGGGPPRAPRVHLEHPQRWLRGQ